jgi:AcrR family transcriptional regulator
MSTTADGRRTGTRARLIDTAIALFRSQGVSGTGLDQVCREAGVTKGVFTHHFPGGKHELVAATVERDSERMIALLVRAYERDGESLAALVRSLFETYARLFRKYGSAFGCPVAAVAVESGSAPQDAALAGAAFLAWRDALVALDVRITPDTATLIVASFEGAILLARATGSAEIFDQLGHSLSRLLDAEPTRAQERMAT